MEQLIHKMKRHYSLIRNIGIIAHIDAGKTTTTERLINRTGLTKRAGSVDTGDTVMDYLLEERERGITITAAAITLPWRGHRINLIDTPGHVDFTVEVERSLRVMDGAVVILDASKGIQAQTLTVWRQAQRHGLKTIIYVNKMDKIGADLEKCLKDVRKYFGVEPILLNEPLIEKEEFKSVKEIDYCSSDFQEKVAQFDDEFLEKYLNGPVLNSKEEVNTALSRITRNSCAIGVLVGSSAKDIGTENILDAIVDLLPGPPPFCNSNGFKALAFKVVFDQKRNGILVYCRVYSGRFSSKKSQLFNLNKRKREQVGKVMQVMADELIEIDSAEEGQIVILLGLKNTATGDTLSDSSDSLEILEGIKVPSPVISASIEAESPGAQDHLEKCLEIVQLEDPSVRVELNPTTGQTTLSGMGELHLEIIESRLKKEMKAKFTTGPIAIAFQESLELNDLGIEKYFEIDRDLFDIKLKGSVKIKIIPHTAKEADKKDEFCILIKNNNDKSIESTVLDAVMSVFGRGPIRGHRLEKNCHVIIDNLQFNSPSSAHVVVYEALQSLLKEAAENSQVILKEPLVRVEIDAPDQLIGDLTTDLFSARRCVECENLGDGRIVARAPLRKMLGYSSWLLSRTAGMASFTMEADGYTNFEE